VFIFSWAYVMFIPSWVNEKRAEVSVNKLVWGAGLFSFFWYVAVGLMAALAFGHIKSDNLLTLMTQRTYATITNVAAYLFSLGVIAPGIPVWYAL
jgi:amino acid permease